MDYRLGLMCGNDLPVPDCHLVIHQPRIKEIGLIGEEVFFIGAQTLTINSSMFVKDKDNLPDIDNFQIFMTLMNERDTKDKKDAVLQVSQILLPEYKPMITPNSLVFQKGSELVMIDKNTFEPFQEVLRLIFCSKTSSMDQQSFNPVNDKAREIAQKLMRGRERIAAEKGSSNSSVFSQYLSILAIGLGMDLSMLAELTIYQLYDLIERYNLYVGWDLDVKQRLAGGKPDKQAENWMKSIH